MRTGVIISTVGHTGALLWAFYGGVVSPPPLEAEYEIADVQIVSEQEFVAATTPVPTVPSAPVVPERPIVENSTMVVQDLPFLETLARMTADVQDESVAEIDPSAAAQSADLDITSESALNFASVPQAPELFEPMLLSLDEPDLAASEIDPSLPLGDKPALQSAPRVADRAAPKPEPHVEEGSEVQVASKPDPTAEPETSAVVEVSTAPAHASSRIVTEAEETAETLPLRRPRHRPSNLASASPPARKPELGTQDNIAGMIEQVEFEEIEEIAKSVIAATKMPEDQPEFGQPLTPAESQRLVLLIQKCWNLGALSTEAARTTVTIGFAMNDQGKPIQNSVKLESSNSDSDLAEQRAFEAGRHAILECLAKGHDLPIAKFEYWRNVEITFDPREMMRK